jgi:hypothetical protein
MRLSAAQAPVGGAEPPRSESRGSASVPWGLRGNALAPASKFAPPAAAAECELDGVPATLDASSIGTASAAATTPPPRPAPRSESSRQQQLQQQQQVVRGPFRVPTVAVGIGEAVFGRAIVPRRAETTVLRPSQVSVLVSGWIDATGAGASSRLDLLLGSLRHPVARATSNDRALDAQDAVTPPSAARVAPLERLGGDTPGAAAGSSGLVRARLASLL